MEPRIHTDSTGTFGETPTGTGFQIKNGGISFDNSTPVAGKITGATIVDPLLPAGGGTETFIPSGVFERSCTVVTSAAGTSEETLWTYTLPAGTFNTNLQTIRWQHFGTFGASADDKTVKTYIGAQLINTSGAIAANAANWFAEGTITRLTETTQICRSKFEWSSNSVAQRIDALSLNLTAAQIIHVTTTQEVGTAGDTVFKGVLLEFLS